MSYVVMGDSNNVSHLDSIILRQVSFDHLDAKTFAAFPGRARLCKSIFSGIKQAQKSMPPAAQALLPS